MSVLFLSCTSKDESLHIIFTGDLMLDRGTRNIINMKGLDYLFDDVQPVIGSTDFTIANLECVACDTTNKPRDKRFTFRANPEWMRSLHKNGITHVTLANNHSFDFEEEGLKQTISNLNSAGIKPIGIHQNQPTVIEKNKNTIAIFSSCFLKQNNKSTNSESASALSKEIKSFKAIYPSCFIIVYLHWGVEMDLEPTCKQVEQAHLLINSGADIIIGHHPHVVQSIEVYKGSYIFYSLGNFIFDNHQAPANRGILADLSVSKGKIKSLQIVPFNIVKSRPIKMSIKESENYKKDISSISNTLHVKQSNGIWKVL